MVSLSTYSLFAVLLLSPTLAAFGASDDCYNTVDGFNHDLSPLSAAFGDKDASVKDAQGNTYYYRPCADVLQVGCRHGGNPKDTTICQQDSRMTPQYHSLGTTAKVQWVPRSGPRGSGFQLLFSGGEEGRQSIIEFVCDHSAGYGRLAAKRPTENPLHFYQFQWNTSYACPVTPSTTCKGAIGQFNYDINPLVAATDEKLFTTQDNGHNTYYYRPCQVLPNPVFSDCGGGSELAACQKDSRMRPLYHSLGKLSETKWLPRISGDNTGFILLLIGGIEDRRVAIEFICDATGGVGTLEAANPSEQPVHYYHLLWKSAYACPLSGDGAVL